MGVVFLLLKSRLLKLVPLAQLGVVSRLTTPSDQGTGYSETWPGLEDVVRQDP